MSDVELDWRNLEVESSGVTDLGPCEHCGGDTRRVWGYVNRGSAPLAAYFVEWVPGRPEHGGLFDLVVGKWGDGSTSADRWVASLDYRIVDGKAALMVVDSASRPVASSDLATRIFRREDIVGTPRAATVFAVADAVFAREPRIEEVREWPDRLRR